MSWWLEEPATRVMRAMRGMGIDRATIARAPGRLDVMGGIADYMGARVCPLPLAASAACGSATRDDHRLVCHSAQQSQPVDIDVEGLRTGDPEPWRDALAGDRAWARYPLGCAWWLMRRVELPPVTLVIDSDVPPGAGVASSAAVEVATMTALCGLAGHALEPIDLAAACQEVENRVVGAPCGVMDQAASCMGEKGALTDILCQPQPDGRPAKVLGHLPIPEGLAFVGIHSGVRHEVRGDPYTDARVAAFIADRFIRDLGFDSEGLLARVPPQRYEREFRQRIPVVVNGWGFVTRFGSTRDTATTVSRDRDYAVRDAADHHIREARRVEQFIEALRAGDPARAGALMDESHASYRDCAHLGHPLTDKLAQLVKQEGEAHGLFGCRVTGGGCGGVVAVLMRDAPEAFTAVERVRKRYTQETGRDTQLFRGSSDGAAATGFREVTL